MNWVGKPAPGEDDDPQSAASPHLVYARLYGTRSANYWTKLGRLAQQALNNPGSVDGTVVGTVFSLAAINGDSALYGRMMAGIENLRTASRMTTTTCLERLANFSDPKLLEKTLAFALTPDVRSQDVPNLIAGVMVNPAGTRLGWDFVRAQWREIAKVLGEGSTAGN